MKKFLLIIFLFFSTNSNANDELINKVLLCSKTLNENSILLLWGIKFLSQNSIEFYVYHTLSESKGEGIEEISGVYNSTFNEINITIDLKPKTYGTKSYTLNRYTLALKDNAENYNTFEKGDCWVKEHKGNNFKKLFVDEYKIRKLILGENRKI